MTATARFIFALALGTVLTAACVRENNLRSEGKLTINVGFEQQTSRRVSSITKTFVSGKQILWAGASSYDKCLFVFDSDGAKNIFRSTSTVDEATRSFTGTVSDGSTVKFVVWTGKSATGDRCTLDGNVLSGTTLALPSGQDISAENSFCSTANIAVMKPGDKALRNVFGYIRYTVPAAETGLAAISSVLFSADENLAGRIRIDYSGAEPVVSIVGSAEKEVEVLTRYVSSGSNKGYQPGTYYAILPPGVYHNMKITVTPVTGDPFTLSCKGDVTIVRGKFTSCGTLPAKDPDLPIIDPDQDPGAEPELPAEVFPINGRWPNVSTSFDYQVPDYKLAKIDSCVGNTFPQTVDKVYYGSGVALGTGNDKFTLNRTNSLDNTYPSAPLPKDGRYISLKINKPGTLSFIPRVQDLNDPPEIFVALETVRGSQKSCKYIYQHVLSDCSTTANDETQRKYLPVTESDLDGITEPATIYIFCKDKLLIIYPIKWIVDLSQSPYYNVDSAAVALKTKVLESHNTIDPLKYTAGKVYFVSAEGNDSNDGLSEAKPIKTLAKVNSLSLRSGDAVLFRRGDTWRRSPDQLSGALIKAKAGVTYSAYGKGEKPRIFGSPWSLASEGTWTLTGTRNVYEYSATFGVGMVGTILFDNKDFAVVYDDNYKTVSQLTNDLDCLQKDGKVYLCSTKGNPGTRWTTAEWFVGSDGIRCDEKNTIDNLCIRYVGAHGIGIGFTTELIVTNCEIGLLGGCFNHAGQSDQVRYGNGVQVFGGCDKYVISNCWVYQCFDAGITHQYGDSGSYDRDCVMQNITYRGNLLEENMYNIEYFNSYIEGRDRIMRNVRIDRNILRKAGYGWGIQRGNAYERLERHIQSWMCSNPAENYVISNNIFDRCTGSESITTYARKHAWMPTFVNNYSVNQQ
ncbi:MAG: right-handed parallel beta-helix repeat-containing protein [Bacteroidales bacterium]|nr:right-handed parallel beta-helix repeat-containing protein [Bacteroidales bacterium]